ncbi:MAG: 3-methyl-2-oxobutanoate hydroxymethyltransferase [Bdellovibrionota bacterium]|jgi:3-methyl-2-oxobutanoate hydroxymethyltransferase|nr:3-methyl-2-oxobutanoate hydroxymethyltransferase [Bdellovibrionota bacterium]
MMTEKRKLDTRKIRKRKIHKGEKPLSMLTCYDFQTAQLIDNLDLDLILVGDSLGNVVLGYETTVEVTLNDMITFGAAVKRGAPQTFTVVDLPFGTYASVESGLKNAIELFQKTKAEALKLEGAAFTELIERLTAVGIPVMGHLGLTPQSVHQQGGYYTHGKTTSEEDQLIKDAIALQKAGCFSLVLECVTPELSQRISEMLSIPTIGIGSGNKTDGQVLVINDLLKMGPERPPQFCKPVADFYELKRQGIELYLKDVNGQRNEPSQVSQ